MSVGKKYIETLRFVRFALNIISAQKAMYEYVLAQAKFGMKAGGTEEEKARQINRWIANKLRIEFGEVMGEDPIISDSLVEVTMHFTDNKAVPANLYTYVLFSGIYIAPWDWIYEDKYYHDKLDVTFYYNYATMKYVEIFGKLEDLAKLDNTDPASGNYTMT